MILRRIAATALVLSLSTPAAAAEPPAPAAPAPSSQDRPGRPLAIAGSVLITASAAGYIVMAVGLGIGSNADAQVASLGSVDELERRREVMDRGQTGNRLALGAGLASAALMATGVALVVVGRRKARQSEASLSWLPLQRGAGLQLGARF